jgi:cell shape-determining protein MreC
MFKQSRKRELPTSNGMKQQFHFRPRTNSNGTPLYAAFLAIALAISIVLGVDVFSGGMVRSNVRTISSSAWTAAAGTLTAIDQSGVLATRRHLVSENTALKEQLSLHDEQSARFRALEAENRSLRELAHFVETQGGLTARVTSSFRASPYGTFTIGAGTDDGVDAGAVVLTAGGIVVGEVTEADRHSASVETLFAPGRMTDLTGQDISFAAEGRGGGNARATVSRDALVVVGDAFTSPGHGGRVAGIVGNIETASSSATQTLYLRVPVNLDTLTFVYVIPRI